MSLTNNPLTITEEQINAFKTWVRERYSDYEAYKTGSKTQNYVDVYIRTNILPPEMKAVWDESERYVGMRTSSTDPMISELKLYRKKIQQKVRYMKDKLGKLAYREEVIQIRLQERQIRLQEEQIRLQERQTELEQERMLRQYYGGTMRQYYGRIGQRIMNSIERRIELEINQAPEEERQQLREQSRTRLEEEFVVRIGRLIERDRINRIHIYNPYPPPIRPLTTSLTTPLIPIEVTYHKKTVTEETLRNTMVDDCCICLNKHTICSVIEGPCGHQIGKGCFQEWAKKSTNTTTTTRTTTRCPLCRTDCNEVTEFIPQDIQPTNQPIQPI